MPNRGRGSHGSVRLLGNELGGNGLSQLPSSCGSERRPNGIAGARPQGLAAITVGFRQLTLRRQHTA